MSKILLLLLRKSAKRLLTNLCVCGIISFKNCLGGEMLYHNLEMPQVLYYERGIAEPSATSAQQI